jgi:DNA-binding GntR family transcriptional regulator
MSSREKKPGAGDALATVVDAVKGGIRTGRYVPGQRLIEADLAAEFGVKRTAVRDALRILAGDGIVELVPQKGARVRRMTHEDLRALVPILAGLLRTTLRLALGRMQQPPLREQLESAMQGLRHARALEDFAQFQFATLRYTHVLHRAAANHFLDYLHAKLHPDLFHRQFSFGIRMADWDGYIDHFERMHAAILAGQLDVALALVDEHEVSMDALFANADADAPPVWR